LYSLIIFSRTLLSLQFELTNYYSNSLYFFKFYYLYAFSSLAQEAFFNNWTLFPPVSNHCFILLVLNCDLQLAVSEFTKYRSMTPMTENVSFNRIVSDLWYYRYDEWWYLAQRVTHHTWCMSTSVIFKPPLER